jgi:hypothetical protein
MHDCRCVLTWVNPLHAVGVVEGVILRVVSDTQTVGLRDGTVGVQVVPSVAGVGDDGVGVGDGYPQQEDQSSPSR